MAKKKSQKCPYQSQSTPEEFMTPACFIADILWCNKGDMKPFFWRDKSIGKKFSMDVQAAGALLKKYPIDIILKALRRFKIKNLSDYGLINWAIKEIKKEVGNGPRGEKPSLMIMDDIVDLPDQDLRTEKSKKIDEKPSNFADLIKKMEEKHGKKEEN